MLRRNPDYFEEIGMAEVGLRHELRRTRKRYASLTKGL